MSSSEYRHEDLELERWADELRFERETAIGLIARTSRRVELLSERLRLISVAQTRAALSRDEVVDD